ncbi:MAG: RNA-binding protein [Coxiellaceae bacterium]|nr:RNA-binding protein [Coxiellaceae bacterium]
MSNSKIYVGSLSYDATSDDLQTFFGNYGEIAEVKLIIDRETNRSKGFAFITFADAEAVEAALKADGEEIQGRKIRVNLARESTGGGGGGRRHGGGGNRRGGGGGGNW